MFRRGPERRFHQVPSAVSDWLGGSSRSGTESPNEAPQRLQDEVGVNEVRLELVKQNESIR
jgi:hypothetical protein